MGATYTRQSSYADGDVIQAADTNDEFNQLLAAFAASTGHTHDGTTAEGGPITKLLGTAITIGDGTSGADIAVTFDGETNDGVLTWKEDEDYFEFSDDILMGSTEKIQFGDTASFIQQSSNGVLRIDGEVTIDLNASTAVTVSNDLKLDSDAAVLGFGADNDVTLTHVADTGLLLNSTSVIQFNDSSQNIGAPNATTLDINATDEVEINATLIDINGNLDVSGTLTIGSAGISEAELEILDGATVTTAELNILDGVTSTTAELNILDGVTSTAAELNIMDGDTTASSTTVVDADRVVFNDDGTMKQVAVTDLAAYFDDEITAMPNLVTTAATTVGALDSGSITSGFGTIDTGSSTITTTGLISGGSLDIDDVLINGATIGHTDDTDLITLANGVVTVAGEVSMTTLDIGGTNVTSTTAELNILDGVTSTTAELNILDGVTSTAAELNIMDGDTTASSTTVADADRVVLNDDGTMKQVAVTDLAAYFDDEITAMPNLVTTAATTVGALDSGSITSGFGTIDTGSSNITTTGLISGGSLDIDDVLINGTTIGHTDDTDLITLANGAATIAGDLTVSSSVISPLVDVADASGTDQAGTALTVQGGAGTGSGAAGKILLKTAPAGSSGSSVNSHATMLSVGGSGVGIGHDSPTAELHIKGDTTDDQVIIENTNAGAANAPDLTLFRNSASPADNDVLGILRFDGKNDAAETTEYASIQGKADDVSDGTEDGIIIFKNIEDGTLAERMRIDGRNVAIGTNSANTYSGFTTVTLGGSGASDLDFEHNGTVICSLFTETSDFNISATNDLVIQTGGSNDRVRFVNDGKVLVAKASSNTATAGIELRENGQLVATLDGGTPAIFNRLTDDGPVIKILQEGATDGLINSKSGDMTIGTDDTGLRFNDGLDAIQPFNASTNAARNDAIDLGTSGAKFDDIHATNGTIQTSDQNEKQDIAALTDKEIKAATAISKLFKTYKYKNSVASKGDNARTHTGVIAQQVRTALEAEGLDCTKYSFWCSDTWWEKEIEVPAVEAADAVTETQKDDRGRDFEVVVKEAVEAQDAYTYVEQYYNSNDAPEGATEVTRLGIRYPELLAFIGAATEQRLTSIEARLTALEG